MSDEYVNMKNSSKVKCAATADYMWPLYKNMASSRGMLSQFWVQVARAMPGRELSASFSNDWSYLHSYCFYWDSRFLQTSSGKVALEAPLVMVGR